MTKGRVFAFLIAVCLAVSFFVLGVMYLNNEDKPYVEQALSSQSITSFPLDINEVTFEQLLEIDGVGESTARKIIDYRTSKGGFKNIDELLQVSGIGEKKLEILKKYLFVKNPVYETGTQTVTTVTMTKTAKPEIVIQGVTINPVTTTKKPSTTKKPVTTKKPATTTTKPLTRKPINLNTASFEEIRDSLLLTDEQAGSIIILREKITYFSNPLEILLATKGDTTNPMFSEKEYDEMKSYLIV